MFHLPFANGDWTLYFLCEIILPEDGYSQWPKHVTVTVLHILTGAVCW